MDNCGKYWMCRESKAKLGNTRKGILNTHKASFPDSLTDDENQQLSGKIWDVRGK